MQCIIWKTLSANAQAQLLTRPIDTNQIVAEQTPVVIAKIRQEGDVALKELTKRYDNVELTQFGVTQQEFALAQTLVTPAAMTAIERAAAQINVFHQPQKPSGIELETSPGIQCETQVRPIQRVGLYVPGGSAPLLSTVLMLGIPSKIAACPLRILCSPPRSDGSLDPHILVAAKICGIDQVYKVGGAQAIAAMAYGTATIPKVDKIFGPGNAWVTQAKQLVALDPQGAACDMPAGPSEVMVLADKYANPAFVAADLLSQAEHGKDSQAILVATDLVLANQVLAEIEIQLQNLSRIEIATAALQHSRALVVENMDQALVIANQYAAEHLILQVDNPRQYVGKIVNAGSVFLGPWSPEAVGDYASGTNHVLPTYGYAHSYSGLSVKDFMKTISFQELTREGLLDIARTVTTLADIEGLQAHAHAVRVRLKTK
ncbi:histidinol dehydrogenase [soil metagenome]